MVKELLWKIPFVGFAIFLLFVEVASYTATKGSIGELIAYPNYENAFMIGSALILIIGTVLIFVRNRIVKIVLVAFICLVLGLFYPIFEMHGVEHSF